ncbi:hypothetical protein BCR36DRAFT_412694 [Piromyces finnis]|uniref:Uncharacterized protein n=1 Tax=Piromyces finnis TaxID=1754191 RepID=A0A1Y1V8E7_9FUNG|nr:hypothetical protein BCR36DRAFT_412694 [Piromyces finnis]|eukprot:ORX49728.1 hypothetical protein BCR36DRAFT_412694 [Piromyces finnis]
MMNNTLLKRENSKIDSGSESESMSDGTIISDDYYNENLYPNKCKNLKEISKFEDYDFYYNYSQIEKYHTKNIDINETHYNFTITNFENSNKSSDENSYDGDLTRQNSTETLINLSQRKQEYKNDKKDALDDFKIYEKESEIINKMLEEINYSDDNEYEDDEMGNPVNKVFYFHNDTKSKLCLSPLQSKIKVNVNTSQEEEENEKKEEKNNENDLSQSDTLIYPKKKNQSKNLENKDHQEVEFNSNKRKGHLYSKSDQEFYIFNSDSSKDSVEQNLQISSLKDKEKKSKNNEIKEPLPIPPRGVSIIHMKNKMKNSMERERVGKIQKEKPNNPLPDKKDFFKFLPINKDGIFNTAEFDTLLKRRYREKQIKILYRTDYYMQSLDDHDYDSYDKALFDEQLFINVERNETDCSKAIEPSKELSNSQKSSTSTNLFDFILKKKKNPNIISPLYQQLVNRIRKNRKERELMEQKMQKQQEEKNNILLSCEVKRQSHDNFTPIQTKSNSSLKDNSSTHLNNMNVPKRTNSIHRSFTRYQNSTRMDAKRNSNVSTTKNDKKSIPSLSSSFINSNYLKKSISCPYLDQQSDTILKSNSISNKSHSSIKSTYAQPTDYYKQYNADDANSNIHRKPSFKKNSYPYQTPLFDNYYQDSQKSYINTSLTDKNSSIDSTFNTATDHTFNNCLNKDFTSFYNYDKTYNLPYTSGFDVLAYY